MDLSGLQDLFVGLVGPHPIWQGLAAGAVIAAMNAAGAMAILVWRHPSQRFLDGALGFAAGIMLTASYTSLILPGIERGGVGEVVVGMALGGLMLFVGDRFVPALHPMRTQTGEEADRLRVVWLFILAVTLHNAPEGLAVGVGFGSGDLDNALSLMLAIGIQNIPEGLAVSVAALNVGLGAAYYAGVVGVRAGMVEIPMALLGAWGVQMAAPALPYAMGFAAGAMIYVIVHEIVPETHAKQNARLATVGLMTGVIVMLYLDTALG